jgi:hypothetical protein
MVNVPHEIHVAPLSYRMNKTAVKADIGAGRKTLTENQEDTVKG